jgi:ceramide glucosyltransferase
VHVRSDYLDRLVAALLRPNVGLVTTLYAGLPAPRSSDAATWLNDAGQPTLPARLGATQITHGFLPSAVLARALGRQDCLGATMCLRRDDLDRIGGLRALVDHLADDNVLGRRISGLGLAVALADTVTLTTVPETSLRSLFRHELRWARTIRALEPAGFAASVVQYPLAWALLTVLVSGGALWSVGLFFIAWVLRAIAAVGVDGALVPLWAAEHGTDRRGGHDIAALDIATRDIAALAFCCPVWLLPLRDVFSVAVMLVSYGGRQVDWRGHGLHADTPPPFTEQSMALRPIERSNAR